MDFQNVLRYTISFSLRVFRCTTQISCPKLNSQIKGAKSNEKSFFFNNEFLFYFHFDENVTFNLEVTA